RGGWISGLSDEEGRRHPTAGGLRIGKPLPERGPDEPFDPRTEWDRDGQYFHYLTKWMHALNRVWELTGEETYHRWATELAEVTQRGFLASGPGGKRLHWKMSVDLSRPLVPSSGHHDPLDGLLTLGALVATAPAGSAAAAGVLERHLRDLREICRGRSWATDEPLGAGALLVDAYRCRRHGTEEHLESGSLCETIVDDAAASLQAVIDTGVLRRPAERRLAFRELGLSIGLRAAEALQGGLEATEGTEGRALRPEAIERLGKHLSLADAIEDFWLDPGNREVDGWSEHRDISRVMLATSLAPGGYLGL
ncbi:MAG: hypothetical protein GWM92_16045, partial [Gemmatimonadetes bacterium]|nr:hypothetical protein [Gemmatimonadota bacterium]NIR80249.1 hypothetical protein [Gemmatimonadota bacterium]NIT89011.1 hypothetical protein [Gemmatimonadota bacterium]NIU32802.1 hypothetical protein [Gemmatimonadota bacterium]NIU37230.1 hypothetical protein [Gemmatimonadota bacterium]